MRLRNKKPTASYASAYRSAGRIVVEGLTPFESASTPSDLLTVIAENATDLVLGHEVLSALRSFGQRPPGDHPKALLAEFGLPSRTALITGTSRVSVTLRHEYDEVMFCPLRKHPPGGWTGNVFDPVHVCPASNTVAVGTLLRQAFDLADDLPSGR